MPSERKVIAYRPDSEEKQYVELLAKKHGLSMARVIGLAVRQMAAREGVAVPVASTDGRGVVEGAGL